MFLFTFSLSPYEALIIPVCFHPNSLDKKANGVHIVLASTSIHSLFIGGLVGLAIYAETDINQLIN